MEDTQIIALYWGRNPAAIEESSNKYGRALHRISFRILSSKEDSEECVNDTYYQAWTSIPPNRPGSLFAYLGRIVRNQSINLWHKNHARKRGSGAYMLLSELSQCVPSGPCAGISSIEEETEHRLLTETINRWLSSLKREDRILFVRRYWYGDSIKELAAECRTSPNQMSGRLFRLRKKLKAALEREGITL